MNSRPTFFPLALLCFVSLVVCRVGFAQSIIDNSGQDEEEFFVILDGFASYGGDTKVVDGLTGEPYTKSNFVVEEVHFTLPKIMGGLHQLLL